MIQEHKKQFQNNSLFSKKLVCEIFFVGLIVGLPSLFFWLLSVLLLSGYANIPVEDPRPALFGLIWLGSGASFAWYFFSMSSLGVVSAYSIVKKYRFSWWLLMILTVYHFFNNLPMYSSFKIMVTITSFREIGLIIWLLCRRQVYGVSLKKTLFFKI